MKSLTIAISSFLIGIILGTAATIYADLPGDRQTREYLKFLDANGLVAVRILLVD